MEAQLKAALPHGLAGIVFDCDGVLLDSRDSNVRYYNLVRAYFGLPRMNAMDEEFVHMHTGMQSLTHVLPPAFLARLGEAMQGIDYMRDLVPCIVPSEGVYELLETMRANGVKLAVHTNRTTLAEAVLEHFELIRYFDPVITARTHAPKPDPEGAQAVLALWGEDGDRVMFVGDSLLDQRAARGAGMAFAAYQNPKLDADVYVQDFGKLHAALRKKL